jgi:type VI protein secretion system component VasK
MIGNYQLSRPRPGPFARARPEQPVFHQAALSGYNVPLGYALVPMGDVEAWQREKRRLLLIFAAVVVVAIVVTWLLARSKEKRPAEVVKRLPTARLAKNLYERLERNGTKKTTALMRGLRSRSEE